MKASAARYGLKLLFLNALRLLNDRIVILLQQGCSIFR